MAAAVLAAAALAVSGCGGEEAQDGDGPVEVVATFSILGDVARAVGGGAISLTTLVGPDGDAHVFEPTPKDGVAVAEADLVLENGLGFEVWLDDLFASSGADAVRVVATEGITPTTLVEDGEEEADPHVWQDVGNVSVIAGRVRDALVEADPRNADTYRENADAYLAELADLDAYVREQVARIPAGGRKLVTNHDAFGYFAKAYGFEVVGTALPASTEAADASAGRIAELVDRIEATGVRAVFSENIESSKLLERVAEASGVVVAPPLYSDALGPEGTAGATYVGMMRANVDAVVEALAG